MRASLKAPRQRESPADCLNNQLDLFNHSVLAHDVAASKSLCLKRAESARHTMIEARQSRGLQIATQHEITREGNVWTVPSQSTSKSYTVNLFLSTCTCADFEAHRIKCKHLFAVEYLLQKESGLTLPVPETNARPKYTQQWHVYNLSQTREESYFKSLLYELCTTIEEPIKPKGRGRPCAPLSDLIYAACIKTYNCMSGRRNQSDLDGLCLQNTVCL